MGKCIFWMGNPFVAMLGDGNWLLGGNAVTGVEKEKKRRVGGGGIGDAIVFKTGRRCRGGSVAALILIETH